jgi:Ca-activated chloride channel family protein
VDRLRFGVIDDGTAIGNGLGLALSRLEDSKAKSRLVILLTDGDNNSGNVSPETAADIAQKLGIKIYTILIGTDKPVPFPAGKDIFGRDTYQTVPVKINPDLLKRLAETTGGKFYRSISTDELRRAFNDIDKLEKSPVPAQKYKLYDEFAPYFIAVALLLILFGRLFALLFPLYPEVER